ncbi:MAG TPA: ATP-binding protein [Anaerolineae bacterium]|nr:ATP-binding protein [Anaerolineae bacterium]
MVNERTLTVPGRYENLARISDFITQVARDAGFDEDDVFHIQMAVDEACSNIIEHAYGQAGDGDIDLLCRVAENGDLVVEIRDHGQPFDPDQVPFPKIEGDNVDLESMKVGGLGLFFMRKLMDEVNFRFDPGAGNHLTMVKRRPR